MALVSPTFDLSGEKDTKITERLSLKLRVDAFDILNHPNFGQPIGNTHVSILWPDLFNPLCYERWRLFAATSA